MQIKLKPGKPTEPGDYLCHRKGLSCPEYARIRGDKDGLYFTAGISGFALKHLEPDTLFSERIDLVIEGVDDGQRRCNKDSRFSPGRQG